MARNTKNTEWKVIGFNARVIGYVNAATEKDAKNLACKIFGCNVSHVSKW